MEWDVALAANGRPIRARGAQVAQMRRASSGQLAAEGMDLGETAELGLKRAEKG